MNSNTEVLHLLPDNKPVRIFLPIASAIDRFRSNCLLQKTSAPGFNLLFKAGVLPAEVIDTEKSCIISVDMGGPSISIEAQIRKIVDDQTLEMVIEKSITHEQMREFFRVDATTEIISSSFRPEFFGNNGEPWKLAGKTIDISGSGILACFETQPPADTQVRLEITLPTSDNESITTLAHPVRSQQIDDNHYEVAYHFDDISTEDRDKIIGWCLIIQRRLLRLKVQVKNPVYP